jgi:hypothetical protein
MGEPTKTKRKFTPEGKKRQLEGIAKGFATRIANGPQHLKDAEDRAFAYWEENPVATCAEMIREKIVSQKQWIKLVASSDKFKSRVRENCETRVLLIEDDLGALATGELTSVGPQRVTAMIFLCKAHMANLIHVTGKDGGAVIIQAVGMPGLHDSDRSE